MSPATLSVWRQQLPEASETALVEIPRQTLASAEPPSTTQIVSVTLPSGLRFDVPHGVDMVWFGQLLQALVNSRI